MKKEIMRHVEKMLPSSNMIKALHNSVGRRGMVIRPAIQLIIKVFEIWFSKKAQDIINLAGILLLNEDSYAFIQSCFLLNYPSVISSMFINKFVQKCQYYYTLSNQSVPLVTVTSIVSLLTKQLCSFIGKFLVGSFRNCMWRSRLCWKD